MKKFLKLKTALQVIIVTFAATALAVGIVAAATSISEAVSVGTDLTVTSGARIGTGSSGGHITALANDSLFIEGQAEFDGIVWFDDSLRASSTLLVASTTTLYSTLTATTTSITANDGSATALTVNQQGAANLIDIQDSGTSRLMIKDGGKTGISSGTPWAYLSVEAANADANYSFIIASSTASGDVTVEYLSVDNTGTITLATTTLSGGVDFTVNTNDLYVDSNNNKVGIGSSTPYALLSVQATAGNVALMIGSSTAEILSVDATGNLIFDTDTIYGDIVNDRVGISSSSPSAMFSVGDGSGTATSTIDMGIPCFRMKSYVDGTLTETYMWPCINCVAENSSISWATSTTSCF